jgi:hypothetical protein
MKIGRFAAQLGYSVFGALAFVGMSPATAPAQDGHVHPPAAQHPQPTAGEHNQTSTFLKIVRESTERFRDVAVAQSEGYALQFGCVSGSVAGGELDVTRPQIVIYEPLPDGRLQLIGADYLVLADAWHATHTNAPQLMGQLFHLFDSPNRFGLPAFYTLHVWAWKNNPNGTFVNWHPRVSCDGFSGTHPIL